MTYRLESIVKKIKSPVIAIFGETEKEYPDGAALSEESFDRYWLVESISVLNEKIVLKFRENDRVNTVEWIGEEAVESSFF